MVPRYLAAVPTSRTEIEQSLLNIEKKQRSNLFAWNGQFSPQLVEVLLKKYAPISGTILDPFAGSGTVLHECGRQHLSGVAGEINPSAFSMARLYGLINVPQTESSDATTAEFPSGPARSHGKRGRGRGPAAAVGGARGEAGGQAAVRDRRRQSLAGGHQPSLWAAASGAALPQSQDSQRGRALAGRPERSGESGDARLLSPGGERRHRPAQETCGLAGAGAAGGGEPSARRAGRMFHHQPLGNSTVVASLPGHHQPDREPAVGGAHANAAGVPLARRRYGRALGGGGVSGDGEKLPSHHGLEGSLATGSDLRTKSKRKRCGQTGGRVRCLRAPLFNL